MDEEDRQSQNPGNPDPEGKNKSDVPPQQPVNGDPSKTRLFPVPQKDDKGAPPVKPKEQAPPTVPEIEEKPTSDTALWKKNPIFISIVVLIGFVLFLFILKMIIAIPGKRGANAAKPPVAKEQVKEVNTQASKEAKNEPKAEPWQYREVTDEAFWGKASIPASDTKTIFSADQDAEVAAIVAALKNHVEIVSESKTANWRNGVRKSVNGTWLGFKVQSNETFLPDREPTGEILVTTPSRVNIRCVDNRLVSMKGSNAEKIKQELSDAGIMLIKNPGKQEGGLVYVRLFSSSFPEVSKDFLITSESVGILKVGSTVSNMESIFPSNYIFLKKRVILGKEFYNIHKIHDQNQIPLLFVYELNGKIIGISPIDEKYRTAKGIGIGSSLAEVLANYGKTNFAFLPGKQTVAKLDEINAQFFFEEQKIDFKNNVFPPEARVETILIGEAPSGEEKL